jgi:tungstate transport system substrate-binding protein
MSSKSVRLVCFVLLVLTAAACFGGAKRKTLRLATTTSVQDSGLLADLLPAFERRGGYHVEVSAVGSGKALELLREGRADVAVTHAPESEQAAVAAGAVGRRTPFMHNDFVIVGPKDQAAVVAGASDFREVLRKIAASGRKFASRGDGSGTHQREQALWKAAGIETSGFLLAASAGMGKTLELASREGAFALSDRSTFFARRGDLDLAIVFQGDDELRNVYSVIEAAAGRDGVDAGGARSLAEFVRSPEGRAVIGVFGVKTLGEPLFTPEE